MKKNQVVSQKAPQAVGPYSQAIEYNGVVYVSGVIAIDPETGTLSGTVEEQTERILLSMKEVLTSAGSAMDRVIKTTVFLKDVKDFDRMNAIYAKHFEKPYPARICVQVAEIPLGALVEIDAIAHK